MSKTPGQLHLILPGLQGSNTGWAEQFPDCSNLQTLLSRARIDQVPGSDAESTLLPLFGIDKPTGRDWPSAALCQQTLSVEDDSGWWLHADPVMLRPDMDRLLVFPAEALEICSVESAKLIDLLNEHFQQDGWRLQALKNDRWLLRLEDDPAVNTHPLAEVAGRSMFPFLPEGEKALHWHGLLNEAQMLLFNADANEKRREQGRVEINGLWFWGGGRLPSVEAGDWTRLLAEHPLARGLGRRAGILVEDLQVPLHAEEGNTLVFRDDLLATFLLGDVQAWSDVLVELEPWFETLLLGTRQGRWSELLLYPCDGRRFRLNRLDLLHFWRRPKPLGQLLSC